MDQFEKLVAEAVKRLRKLANSPLAWHEPDQPPDDDEVAAILRDVFGPLAT